jgi:hypothetical protein
LHCDPQWGALQSIFGRFRRKSLTAKPGIPCDLAVQFISDEAGHVVPRQFHFIRSAVDGPAEMKWLRHGLVAAGNVTLFTSLWRSGKTTLVAVAGAGRRAGPGGAGRGGTKTEAFRYGVGW